MAILEKEVWVKYNYKSAKHYEEKGYKFPKSRNKWGKSTVSRGTKIAVKIEDLLKAGIKVTKICDVCGETVPNQIYQTILNCRKNNKDGLDRCKKCSAKENGIVLAAANELNCITTTHPEFAKLFWNEEDTFTHTHQSNKKVDFKCSDCGSKIENRQINSIYQKGLSCVCRDGLSYPEKFMYKLLEQILIKFDYHKKFKWSKNKEYDFYLPTLNVVIETHGKQHYEESSRGRTLLEEQENDRLKERLSKENKISNYIVVDCRKSEMEFIKNNILNSKLNELFDLSKVDWLKCHEFACKTLVKVASELWNEGKSAKEISEKLKLSKTTVIKYLKQGVVLQWCYYNPKKEISYSPKKVVQLTLNGDYLKTWESALEAQNNTTISNAHISKVCNGKRTQTGDYKWMFKTDYDKYIEQNKKELLHK